MGIIIVISFIYWLIKYGFITAILYTLGLAVAWSITVGILKTAIEVLNKKDK